MILMNLELILTSVARFCTIFAEPATVGAPASPVISVIVAVVVKSWLITARVYPRFASKAVPIHPFNAACRPFRDVAFIVVHNSSLLPTRIPIPVFPRESPPTLPCASTIRAKVMIHFERVSDLMGKSQRSLESLCVVIVMPP